MSATTTRCCQHVSPGAGLWAMLARIGLPYRVLASVCVPGGRVVLAFVSDSALLSCMFAANWAQAEAGQEPDATLYALAGSACGYGLDRRWDGAISPSSTAAHACRLRTGCG